MKYDFQEHQLKMNCINFSSELIKNNDFLNNPDVTVFNSSIIQIENTDDLLIASRGWYGNIRSWDGINFVILSIFSKDFKKKKQNILDIDKNALKDIKKEYKELKKDIIPHGEKLLKGPEDPRLFYHNDDLYILLNDLTPDNQRHMFVSKINLDKLEYSNKIKICEDLSTKFEKNWGSFIYNDKLHMLYDINPLKIFELEDDFKCKEKFSVNSEILKKLTEIYPELHFHIRNSTNLVALNDNEFLGLGHGVLDYKNDTDINKYLIPLLNNSDYSKSDKDYFNKFFKFYTGFFYKMDMEKQEITEISPLFQFPNKESKQELIFFPTSIFLDQEDYLNISYNIGDNRSYFLKLHLDVILLSLYEKQNIDFMVNYNINSNFFIELMRNIRKYMGFSTKIKNYYTFKDSKELKSGTKKKTKRNKKRKTIKKKKTKKKITKKKNNKKILYFYMDGCKYCHMFEKTWSKLETTIKNIKFMKINGPENTRMSKKYNVESYPTIILVTNKSYKTFEDKRTYQKLKEFISN